MLHSTRNYRATINRAKHSGFEVIIEQECFFLWIFRFWDISRITHATTISYAQHIIEKMAAIYGPLLVIDNSNILAA